MSIVERMAEGDRTALTELYERYRQSLFAYLRSRTPDRDLAEEIVQDTLLAAWAGAHGFTGQASVQSWLFGIARRRTHDALRRRTLRVVGTAALESMPDPGPDPEDAALAGATREELVATMGQLAPIHREVLVLVFVHGFSHRELAEVLGIPIGTVKSRLSNAKRALRALLHNREGGNQ
ncbi:MAG: RNA polymerase sigma factor [Haloechinothrix sp.]